MAGPLSGIGNSGQIPLSTNTPQPAQNNDQLREQDEREPQENRVQTQNTAAAESQNSETGNQQDVLRARQNEVFDLQNTDPNAQGRGSLVDITV